MYEIPYNVTGVKLDRQCVQDYRSHLRIINDRTTGTWKARNKEVITDR